MTPEKYNSKIKFPNVQDAVKRMQDEGIITSNDAEKYTFNYEYFMHNLETIEDSLLGKWVGSVNGKILSADTDEELRKLMDQEPDSNRGYIEHVGSVFH